jgi:hypothetical protein
MSFMPEEEMALFDSRVTDRQLMPTGLWLVITVHAYRPGSLYKLSVIWHRKGGQRKTYKSMRLKPVVLPETPHDPSPYVSNDWVYGVKDRESYGILLDIDYHGLRHNGAGVEISFQVEPIEVLDLLAGV